MTDHRYPEASRATAILVLGILSFVLGSFCGVGVILGPIAWIMGNRELTGIAAGRRSPRDRSTAQSGRVLGIIATAMYAVILVVVLFVLVLGSVAGW